MKQDKRAFPPRPYVPGVFLLGLSCWLSGGLLFPVAKGFSLTVLVAIALTASAFLVVGIALMLRGSPKVVCLLLGLSLGLLFSAVHAAILQCESCLPGNLTRSYVMVEDSKSQNGRELGLAKVVEGENRGQLVEVSLEKMDHPVLFGQKFSSNAELTKPSPANSMRLWEKGCVACMSDARPDFVHGSDMFSALVAFRQTAVNTINNSTMSDSSKSVMLALSCGYKRNITNDSIYDKFKADGLAHVVAVSGAHLTIVVMLLEAALKALGLGRRSRIGLQSGFIISYLVFAAAPISAIRASAMAVASLVAFFPGRRSSSLSAIGVLLMVIGALSPSSLCSLSLLLSAGSTIGIVLFSPLIQVWISSVAKLPIVVEESLALTLASGLVTGPVSACLFSQVSLVSIGANILVAPIFTSACGLGLAAVVFAAVFPMASSAVLWVASLPSGLLCEVVNLCAMIPYACVPFYGIESIGLAMSVLLSAALILAWPRPRPRLFMGGILGIIVFAFACTVLSPLVQGPRIVMLDVGQGDSILIQDGRSSLLIDTGTNDALLKQALARQKVNRLDAVLVTHGDDDHDGSLVALSQVVEVGKAFVAKDSLSCGCKNCANLRWLLKQSVGEGHIVGLVAGDGVTCGRFRLKVLWPYGFSDQGGNPDSLCILVEYDEDADGTSDGSALLVGDAEGEVLDQLVSNGLPSPVDIYKVAHHGSKAAVTEEALETLMPSVSLISVGENNRYGHPAKVTIDQLEKAGSHVYRTDLSGDITCTFQKGALDVRTQK